MTTVRITSGELSNHRNGLSDFAIRHANPPDQGRNPFGLTRPLAALTEGRFAIGRTCVVNSDKQKRKMNSITGKSNLYSEQQI